MKESEACKKICPILKPHHEVNRGFYCYTTSCMMWESWPLYENGQLVKNDDGTYKMSDSGDCGLKSKELEVSL